MPKPVSSTRVHSGLIMHHDTASARRSQHTLTGVHSTPKSGSLSYPKGALYVPFSSKDMVIAGAGFNVARVIAGKPLYPLIAHNDQQRDDLEKWRQIEIKRLSEIITPFLPLVSTSRDVREQVGEKLRSQHGVDRFERVVKATKEQQRIMQTLASLQIVSNQNNHELSRLQPGRSKLYLLGHSGPGKSKLGADPQGLQTVTATELAKQLAEGGLNVKFSDIRVIACFSADALKPESFAPGNLKRAARPSIGTPRFLRGVGSDVNAPEPFAQTLCNELRTVGFKQPVVCGYHGAGILYSTTHHYRSLPGTQEPEVRSSTVRRRFTPTRRILSLVGL